MKIAVVTGASSGLGTEYCKALDALNLADEIWLVARRKDRLVELSRKLNTKSKVLAFDITDQKGIELYENELKNSGAEVKFLINNAGFGRLNKFCDITTKDNADMVRLNCEALTVMTNVTLPYIKNGGHILNTCSIAAFAPNTRLAVYSSTKAYVMSLSLALSDELKENGITVTAVCPGPMDTEFLPVAGIEKGSSHTFDTLPRVNPAVMAEKSLKAAIKGKTVYTNKVFYKFYRFVSKLLPIKLVMKMAKA